MAEPSRSGPTRPDEAATAVHHQDQDTPAAIAQAMARLVVPGQVVELRIPDGGRDGVVAGYFNDLDKLALRAAQASERYGAVYFTLNPVKPALLARYRNRLETRAKLTTSDRDIARRRWLPVDIDPIRPAGIPSSDAEHQAALEVADKVATYLNDQDWPAPVRLDSGNGATLYYPLDLTNDQAAAELERTVLEELASRFNTDQVKVDTSVWNASRIMRVPGTINAKGDGTDDRPHRPCRLLEAPEPGADVTPAQAPGPRRQRPPGVRHGPGRALRGPHRRRQR
jgi:hypothetical protein